MAKTKADIRHEKIIKLLNSYDNVSIAEFCQRLECSESTIRNDLTYLEKNGALRRTFGGAIKTEITPYNLLDSASRETVYLMEKRSIAEYVVKNIIKSGATIVLDSGTTCAEIAKVLVEESLPVTVLTVSLLATNILVKSDVIRTYCIGGFYDKVRETFYDEYMACAIKNMYADLFFMGVDGVSTTAGITLTAGDDMSYKNAFISMSKEVFVVADHSKLGRIAFRAIGDNQSSMTVITDRWADMDKVSAIDKSGLKIIVPSENR